MRLRDAPGYLGMDRNRFNAEVRPHLIEIPIGTVMSRLYHARRKLREKLEPHL